MDHPIQNLLILRGQTAILTKCDDPAPQLRPLRIKIENILNLGLFLSGTHAEILFCNVIPAYQNAPRQKREFTVSHLFLT